MSATLGKIVTDYRRKLTVLVEREGTYLTVENTVRGSNITTILTREECAALGTLLLEAAMGQSR